MKEPKDSEAADSELINPPYEIALTYGVWPSGDSDDKAYAMGDDLTTPWEITFPEVKSSTTVSPTEAPAEDSSAESTL